MNFELRHHEQPWANRVLLGKLPTPGRARVLRRPGGLDESEAGGRAAGRGAARGDQSSTASGDRRAGHRGGSGAQLDRGGPEGPTDADLPLSLATDHEAQVILHGVDAFDPSRGEVRSDGPDGIAWWFIDTNFNEESFFVRQAYFLGASDPYKSLKTTLKAEIDEDAWSTLNSGTSRPFARPTSGRIAVKVINHLGDEVMKVFRA